jgi:hypothetical protein
MHENVVFIEQKNNSWEEMTNSQRLKDDPCRPIWVIIRVWYFDEVDIWRRHVAVMLRSHNSAFQVGARQWTATGHSSGAELLDSPALQQPASQSDRVGSQSDKVSLKADRLSLRWDRVGLQSDRLGLQSDRVFLQSDRLSLQWDRVGLLSDRLGLQSDRVAPTFRQSSLTE